ncbi:MAG: GNAT family N-acetyltransferase [Bacteroidota bacterium]
MSKIALTFEAVGKNNWPDLEQLFESKGGPHSCWCMVWRNMKPQSNRSKKQDKKDSLKKYVEDKSPIGILCYHDSSPIAWCSIAPRHSYRELGGDTKLENVWSLVCFFIKKGFRRQGIQERLLLAAEQYAFKNGAKYIEAYPVLKDSPSYRFMGFTTTFENLEYKHSHQVGKRRFVMFKKL